MPGFINATGFPVPESFDNDVARRPAMSDALDNYLRQREEAVRKHTRQLAKAVNAAGMAAFSPKTYIKALTADVTATGTTTGTSVQLTDLTHTIVTPVPALLWFDLTARCAESGGVQSAVVIEVKIDGTIYTPRIVQTLVANTTECVTICGAYDSASADGAFWLHPQTTYSVTVHVWKGVAGATVKVEKGTQGDTCLRVRVEPRLLLLTP